MTRQEYCHLMTNKDKSWKEYAESPEAEAIINDSDLLKRFEGYHLPEITKLICSSDELLKSEDYNDYEILKPYFRGEVEWQKKICEATKTDDELTTVIRLNPGKDFYIDFIKWYKELDEKIEKIGEKIKEAKKKKKDTKSGVQSAPGSGASEQKTKGEDQNPSESAPPEETPNKKADLEKEKKDLEGLKDNGKKLNDKAKDEQVQIMAEKSKEREEAMKVIVQYPNLIEVALGGDPTELNRELKNNVGFWILKTIKQVYGGKEIETICKLYDRGVDRISESEDVVDFLYRNPEELCRYASCSENSREYWHEFIIKGFIEDNTNYFQYEKFWIDNWGSDWNEALDQIKKKCEDHCKGWAKLLLTATGSDRRELLNRVVDLVLNDKAEAKIIEALFTFGKNNEDAAIIAGRIAAETGEIVRQMEDEAKKSKNIKEGYAANLYAGIRESVEGLESLTIDLLQKGKTDGVELLCRHVKGLREWLAEQGIKAVISYDDWRKQKPANYDPKIHRAETEPKGQVIARTRGFQYTDREDREKTVPAIVQSAEQPKQLQRPAKKKQLRDMPARTWPFANRSKRKGNNK